MIIADTEVSVDFLGDLRAAAQRHRDRADRARNHDGSSIANLLSILPVLSFDERAADHAARARIELERNGQRIGMADFMIAGIAIANGAQLLTRNRRHFERVRDLGLVAIDS